MAAFSQPLLSASTGCTDARSAGLGASRPTSKLTITSLYATVLA